MNDELVRVAVIGLVVLMLVPCVIAGLAIEAQRIQDGGQEVPWLAGLGLLCCLLACIWWL